MTPAAPLYRCCSLLLAALLLCSGGVRAQDGAKDSSLEDARAHVSKAKVHYDLGEYEQAAEEYIQVYRIRALPALLFNIAQAYRQAGKYEKARQFYKSFLRESPDQKSKPVIEKAIKEIDELLAKDRRARESAPTGTADAEPLSTPGQPERAPAKQPAAAPRQASLGAGQPARQGAAAADLPAPRQSPALAEQPRASADAKPAGERSKAQPASSTAPADSRRAATVAIATTQPPRAAAPSEITQRSALPATSSTAEEGAPLYKKWWLWTAVGVVAVGAGAAAMTLGGNTAPGSHFGTSKVFP